MFVAGEVVEQSEFGCSRFMCLYCQVKVCQKVFRKTLLLQIFFQTVSTMFQNSKKSLRFTDLHLPLSPLQFATAMSLLSVRQHATAVVLDRRASENQV